MITTVSIARNKAQADHPGNVTAFLHGVNLVVPIGYSHSYVDYEGTDADLAAVAAGRDFGLWIKAARQ